MRSFKYMHIYITVRFFVYYSVYYICACNSMHYCSIYLTFIAICTILYWHLYRSSCLLAKCSICSQTYTRNIFQAIVFIVTNILKQHKQNNSHTPPIIPIPSMQPSFLYRLFTTFLTPLWIPLCSPHSHSHLWQVCV